MQIQINPIAALPGEPDDVVSVSGESLTVNGLSFDLAPIPEGGEGVPDGDHPFAGPIRRLAGELIVPLVVRYDSATAVPDQPTDWAHWTVTVTSGALPDRVLRKPE